MDHYKRQDAPFGVVSGSTDKSVPSSPSYLTLTSTPPPSANPLSSSSRSQSSSSSQYPDSHPFLNLTSLPPELLIKVILNLDWRTILLRLRLVSSTFAALISEHTSIRYHVELGVAGMVHGQSSAYRRRRSGQYRPSSSSLSTADRLARLRVYQERWRKLTPARVPITPDPSLIPNPNPIANSNSTSSRPAPTTRSLLPGSSGARSRSGRMQTVRGVSGSGVWELNGGVLARGVVCSPPPPPMVTTRTHLNMDGDPEIRKLQFTRLPLSARAGCETTTTTATVEWEHGEYEFPIRDFTFDPSQDLLVILRDGTSENAFISLYLRSLHTNQKHPRAKSEILRHELEGGTQRYSHVMQVCGERFGVLHLGRDDVWPEKLVVYDWRKGRKEFEIQFCGILSYTFLTPSFILIAVQPFNVIPARQGDQQHRLLILDVESTAALDGGRDENDVRIGTGSGTGFGTGTGTGDSNEGDGDGARTRKRPDAYVARAEFHFPELKQFVEVEDVEIRCAGSGSVMDMNSELGLGLGGDDAESGEVGMDVDGDYEFSRYTTDTTVNNDANANSHFDFDFDANTNTNGHSCSSPPVAFSTAPENRIVAVIMHVAPVLDDVGDHRVSEVQTLAFFVPLALLLEYCTGSTSIGSKGTSTLGEQRSIPIQIPLPESGSGYPTLVNTRNADHSPPPFSSNRLNQPSQPQQKKSKHLKRLQHLNQAVVEQVERDGFEIIPANTLSAELYFGDFRQRPLRRVAVPWGAWERRKGLGVGGAATTTTTTTVSASVNTNTTGVMSTTDAYSVDKPDTFDMFVSSKRVSDSGDGDEDEGSSSDNSSTFSSSSSSSSSSSLSLSISSTSPPYSLSSYSSPPSPSSSLSPSPTWTPNKVVGTGVRVLLVPGVENVWVCNVFGTKFVYVLEPRDEAVPRAPRHVAVLEFNVDGVRFGERDVGGRGQGWDENNENERNENKIEDKDEMEDEDENENGVIVEDHFEPSILLKDCCGIFEEDVITNLPYRKTVLREKVVCDGVMITEDNLLFVDKKTPKECGVLTF